LPFARSAASSALAMPGANPRQPIMAAIDAVVVICAVIRILISS
jgi:hypothetical protein